MSGPGLAGNPFELTISNGAMERLRVGYWPEKHVVILESKETVIETGGPPRLRGFDEPWANLSRRIGYTKCVYIDGPVAPNSLVRVTGPSSPALSAWKVAAIA